MLCWALQAATNLSIPGLESLGSQTQLWGTQEGAKLQAQAFPPLIPHL